jgi:hypothetical protein
VNHAALFAVNGPIYNGTVTSGTYTQGTGTGAIIYVGCGFLGTGTSLGTETPAFATATFPGGGYILGMADVPGGPSAYLTMEGFSSDPTQKFLAFAKLASASFTGVGASAYGYTTGTSTWHYGATFGFNGSAQALIVGVT